ncbi:MAG: tyrosine-type recombinase/integrase, partial [Bacillota bacterium]
MPHNTFGNPLDAKNFVSRYFKSLLKPAGIDESFTFHGLRHTHATLLLKQGVNPKVIQERLGHANI